MSKPWAFDVYVSSMFRFRPPAFVRTGGGPGHLSISTPAGMSRCALQLATLYCQEVHCPRILSRRVTLVPGCSRADPMPSSGTRGVSEMHTFAPPRAKRNRSSTPCAGSPRPSTAAVQLQDLCITARFVYFVCCPLVSLCGFSPDEVEARR